MEGLIFIGIILIALFAFYLLNVWASKAGLRDIQDTENDDPSGYCYTKPDARNPFFDIDNER